MPISLDGSGSISGISTFSFSDEIIHTGDTNTAIKFPANDTVSIDTSGSERVRIDQYGRVMIGTTTVGDAGADDFNVATTGQTGITIRSGTSSGGQIYFADGTSGDDRYRGIISYQHGSNYMRFYTNAVERLRIASDGKIGIGVASPTRTIDMHVTDSGANYLHLTNTGTGTGDSNGVFIGLDDAEGAIIWNQENNYVRFGTNNIERLRIDLNGNIGAGTGNTTIDEALCIERAGNVTVMAECNTSGSGANAAFRLKSADSSSDWYMQSGNVTSGGLRFYDGNASAERLRITSAGIIQCGTSGVLKAEINNAVSGHQFISQCSNNNNGFEVYQQHGSTTTRNTFAAYANTGSGGAKELHFAVRGDGAVTKPKTPAFFATHSGASNTQTGYLVYNTSGGGYYNDGGHFNVSTGAFTAPVTGIYHFHFHGFFQTGAATGDFEVNLYRTNSDNSGTVSVCRQYGNKHQLNNYGPSISIHYTGSLTAGQYVRAHTGKSFHGSNGYFFGGYLIG